MFGVERMINVNCRDCKALVENIVKMHNGDSEPQYYCMYCGHEIRDIEQNIDCLMYRHGFDF